MKKHGVAALLAVSMSGCAADYVTGNNSPVNLIIAGISTAGGGVGGFVKSDVDPAQADFANVSLAVRTKNPNVDITQRIAMAVVVERYEVRFFRSDGRNTEGVDVPFRISGATTFALDVENSGTSDLPIEIVRAQAKLEPPLRNLRKGLDITGNGGGSLVMSCFAEITIHGHTIAGQAVTASGRIQVDFADYE